MSPCLLAQASTAWPPKNVYTQSPDQSGQTKLLAFLQRKPARGNCIMDDTRGSQQTTGQTRKTDDPASGARMSSDDLRLKILAEARRILGENGGISPIESEQLVRLLDVLVDAIQRNAA